ncbi:MAG: class I SAM-dependent methyltransferase [Armatimonadota bacterium]|nr:class I SAM-dependent methyltransferase [Armatimonadota bacterium]
MERERELRGSDSETESELGEVAAAWGEVLRESGYELSVTSMRDVRRLSRLSRTWRIILAATGLKPPASVFEVGCGGGAQLIPLALNGFTCRGIDASAEVLARLANAVERISRLCNCRLTVETVHGDFLNYRPRPGEEYDLVFHFGVLEHFLDEAERLKALATMAKLCRAGGYLVSVVPNGMHPLRERQRRGGLGGYCVPEIDYNPGLMILEFMRVGAQPLLVRAHNLFSYLLMEPAAGRVRHLMHKAIYYAAQAVPLMTGKFATCHAGTFIGIARRPGGTHE